MRGIVIEIRERHIILKDAIDNGWKIKVIESHSYKLNEPTTIYIHNFNDVEIMGFQDELSLDLFEAIYQNTELNTLGAAVAVRNYLDVSCERGQFVKMYGEKLLEQLKEAHKERSKELE